MPKKEEEALMREADKKGLKGKRKDAYVYGTLRKQGWKPKDEKKNGKKKVAKSERKSKVKRKKARKK
ncbi:hypothetical protein AB832_08110 [Flavobacteriaceae bacterium (ex Bugula neritina AB1)]|jgi:hypothetical protein|nr:hypothetical protein AB832_08110 [Flavobacteriaceae bacterium (ex Bugula neritina AB1)]